MNVTVMVPYGSRILVGVVTGVVAVGDDVDLEVLLGRYEDGSEIRTTVPAADAQAIGHLNEAVV